MATATKKSSEQKSGMANRLEQGSKVGRISREDIQKKAYELFQRRGGFPGQDLADWLEAEKLLMGRK